MLGIEDPQIIIGYGLSIALAIICALYGVLNWNKEGVGDG
jgi:hypothetical protein